MFCKNCGATIADGTRFCAACGATVEAPAAAPVQAQAPVYAQAPVQAQAPVYAQAPVQGQVPVQGQAPVYVQQVYVQAPPSPTMTNFVAWMKGFFVKPIATIGSAAKSNSHEWALFMAIAIVSYALGTAVVGSEMMSQLIHSLAGSMASFVDIGSLYPFFAILGIGILVGAVAFFGVSFGIWLLVSQIFKKQASIINVFNMVSVASLPMAAISIANMLFGLVYSPLTLILFLAATMMTVICLYTGIQKFDKLDKSPFYGFSIVLAIVMLVVCLLGSLYFTAIGNHLMSSVGSMMGSALGGLGDLADLF